jgi:hypothetical protein
MAPNAEAREKIGATIIFEWKGKKFQSHENKYHNASNPLLLDKTLLKAIEEIQNLIR